MRLTELKPIFYADAIPSGIEFVEGIIYVSVKYKTATHLCACGCGEKVVTPLGDDGWKMDVKWDKVTLRPSIGNFNGEKPYHAHYFITENRIDWC